MDDEPRLWSTEELAKEIGVTARWIRKQCADGKIQAQMVGRDWIIPDEEARRVIAERVQNSAE